MYCVIGITMLDIYWNEDTNFCYGSASLTKRGGVFSFHWYLSADNEWVTLKRALKIVAHEICHMFGMRHCVFYHCLMNGAMYSEEEDAKPFSKGVNFSVVSDLFVKALKCAWIWNCWKVQCNEISAWRDKRHCRRWRDVRNDIRVDWMVVKMSGKNWACA